MVFLPLPPPFYLKKCVWILFKNANSHSRFKVLLPYSFTRIYKGLREAWVCGGGRVERGGGGGGVVASAMCDEAKLISRNSQKVPTARGK